MKFSISDMWSRQLFVALRRMRSPAISRVSPSMTRAGPVISANAALEKAMTRTSVANLAAIVGSNA